MPASSSGALHGCQRVLRAAEGIQSEISLTRVTDISPLVESAGPQNESNANAAYRPYARPNPMSLSVGKLTVTIQLATH